MNVPEKNKVFERKKQIVHYYHTYSIPHYQMSLFHYTSPIPLTTSPHYHNHKPLHLYKPHYTWASHKNLITTGGEKPANVVTSVILGITTLTGVLHLFQAFSVNFKFQNQIFIPPSSPCSSSTGFVESSASFFLGSSSDC